mmetsp:Transcript_7076/g.22339  ORF Transcript_7076/g.22339 Transcript_7076/m.22339 type:complete len:232 (+) Transcript_7076:242-937(+)
MSSTNLAYGITPAVMTTSSYFFATRSRNWSTKGRLRTRAVHQLPLSENGASKSASNVTSKLDRTSVSSRSSTSVMRWSDGSRGSRSMGARRGLAPPPAACRLVAGAGASRCFAPRVKKPILGKLNFLRGATTLPFLSRGDVASEGGARPFGDGMGEPNAFSSALRGANVAWRARILRSESGEGGSMRAGSSLRGSGFMIFVLIGVAGDGGDPGIVWPAIPRPARAAVVSPR